MMHLERQQHLQHQLESLVHLFWPKTMGTEHQSEVAVLPMDPSQAFCDGQGYSVELCRVSGDSARQFFM
jgi:hypothetical protein